MISMSVAESPSSGMGGGGGLCFVYVSGESRDDTIPMQYCTRIRSASPFLLAALSPQAFVSE